MSAEKTLDKIAKIVAKEKQDEIERLRKQIEMIRAEGVELAHNYYFSLAGNMHDIYDFLMAL